MEAKYRSIISLQEAVQRLNLKVYGQSSESSLVPTDVSQVNIMCPRCGHLHETKRLTLNLNFEENVFCCPRCNFSGGVYKLISQYTGWQYNEVVRNIQAGKLGPISIEDQQSIGQESIVDIGHPIAPLKQRDEVYRAMLSQFKLNQQHYENLIQRGLSKNDIERIGFKSYPKYMDPTVVPKKLISAGYDLRGVPGFYVNDTGNWSIVKLPDGGFFIPSRNGQDLIFGCQVRFDHPNSRIPKFGYFTSSNKLCGTKAETWCSWAGEDLVHKEEKSEFDVILIEGPLKAYIVNAITGCNVIAVPGVNALKRVPSALQSMLNYGLRCVYIAYDMDQFENKQVSEQLDRLRNILSSVNINHRTLQWNRAYKGLDDWVVSPEFKSTFPEVVKGEK